MIQIALLFMQIFTELIFREIDTIGLIWKYLSIHEIFDDYLCKLLLSVIFWFPFEAFVWLLFFFLGFDRGNVARVGTKYMFVGLYPSTSAYSPFVLMITLIFVDFFHE